MGRNLSTAEASRILGMKEPRIRELVRSGLCRPARRGRRYAFNFADLVVLRAAQGLLERGVPMARVRRALAALVAQLPEQRQLSGVRIYAEGLEVAVRDGGAPWQPETGQTLLDFEVASLAERVETLSDLPQAAPDSSDPPLRAEAFFEQALELEDVDPRAAANAYGRALELDPQLVEAYVNLGRLAHEAGDAKEGARLYRLALERAPVDPVIHFNLALALEDVDGAESAIEHYQRAISLDPTFADAHFNLAGLCETLGRGADALRHYHAYKKLTDG